MDLNLTLTAVPVFALVATWMLLGVYVKTNVPTEVFPSVFKRVTRKTVGFIIAPAATLAGVIFLILHPPFDGALEMALMVLYGALTLLQFGLTVAVILSMDTEILDALEEVEEVTSA